MIDPMVSLAFTVYSNKGVYALLLGSGISRASGIPTGWEIVIDLIRKVAKLNGENCEPDPADWFRKKYGSEPDYSKLLGLIAKTPAERQRLLRGYFEPTEEERNQGQKLPTAAHKAIAKLVAAGYFRVIITTNFDRLTEMALEELGVIPTVISTTDQLKGALPLVHSGVTIIKLHGDYLDTRIKNTQKELAAYDEALNKQLDRVLDEYGLIVCGWSADWDPALRSAIERCPNRRFTTFWTTKSSLSEQAESLAKHRKSTVLQIKDANCLFETLWEKVQALEDMAAPHPLSTKMAVATVKRYLVDPAARIKLHDLVVDETERVYAEFSEKRFPIDSTRKAPTDEDFSNRGEMYDSLTESLLEIIITGCFWGENSYANLWLKSVERIATPSYRRGSYYRELESMRRYPAMLLVYGGGVAAIAAGRYDTLAVLLAKPHYFDGNNNQPVITGFPYRRKIDYEHFRKYFNHLIPGESDFRDALDRFEYLLGLLCYEYNQTFWIGNYFYRSEFGREITIIKTIDQEIVSLKDNSPYLKAGLFEGSLSKFQSLHADFSKRLQESHRLRS